MRNSSHHQPPLPPSACVFNMKFCRFSLLLSYVSLVAALPTRLGSTSPVRVAVTTSEKQVLSSYAELAASAFNAVLFVYGSFSSPFFTLWNIVRSDTTLDSYPDALSMLLLPDASNPSGHGKCAEDQFWFGPKQTCVGGTGTEDFIQPPPGYYCPVDWSFSNGLGCCMPHTVRAISKNDCRNGNGTWDLIRIVCVERESDDVSKHSSIVNQASIRH